MTREKIIQTVGLSREDLDVLFLLEKAIQADAKGQVPELTVEEKKLMVTFLEKSIGNMELNKQLLELGKLGQQDTGVSYAVINTLRNVTFKSRRWHENQFDEQDKITLSQFGALSDLASLTRDLAVFERSGLLVDTSPLSQLYNDAKKAKGRVGLLEERFSNELKNSSDMMFFEVKATKGAPMFPNTDYRKNEFVLTEFLYSEEYRIKLDKLIERDATKESLKKHLGDNWLQQLEKQFGIIQREIHDAQLIGPIYHAAIPQDASAQEHFRAEDKSPVTLICSPFVGISTIATIKELNTWLVHELKNKGVSEIPSPLLQLPISEKLEALSPSHFIDALGKCNALERLSGQVTSMMRTRLSDTKSEGEEDHSSNRPK